ncbi:MAG: hypothetical protein PHU71_01835 [Candidatus Gracilibacteria bacterium]|nr:hypothetical protein [Candidatus Gracilibacteria bacterium]
MKKLLVRINDLDPKILFLACWALSFGIFYLRFPYPFQYPNFYAEDAAVLLDNILHNGFLPSLFSKFNGYPILGLYSLAGIAILLNKIFLTDFANLPIFFCITANLFFAGLVSLPVILFHSKIKTHFLLILVLLSAFVALRGWEYVIFGVIGNTKFLFLYLAFLLVGYRLTQQDNKKSLLLVDLGLLICALTNLVSYALIFVIYLSYLYQLLTKQKSLKTLYKQPAFISAMIMGFVLLYPVFNLLTQGSLEKSTYMSDPYVYSKTIDIFIGRSIVFPLIVMKYHFMNNIIICLLFLGLMGGALLWSRKNLWIHLLAFYAILINNVLLVSARPGIHAFFDNFQGQGPSQYFYAQNLIAIFSITLIAYDAFYSKSKPKLAKSFAVLIILLISVHIPFAAFVGRTNKLSLAPLIKIGSFKENIQIACNVSNEAEIAVSIYPNQNQQIILPRNLICQDE